PALIHLPSCFLFFLLLLPPPPRLTLFPYTTLFRSLLAARVEHAVADEAVADADEHRHLSDAPAHGHRRRDRGLRRLGAAHDLEEPHDVGGGEEVHADDALGPRGRPGDRVDVERRGV